MIDFQVLVERWSGGPLSRWADCLQAEIDRNFHSRRYGELPQWLATLDKLPDISASQIDLNCDAIRVGSTDDASPELRAQLDVTLQELRPWRKGPFDLFGIHIDTEWRSDWKWNRLLPGLEPLTGRRVLDVGCGSGYHCWRMLGAGAAEVIGIDPTPLFVIQFQALQRYIQNPAAWVLPLGIEQMPEQLEAFDTVFSMGVLYHRRSPIGHLTELRDALRDGGQLLLETLVIEGGTTGCLVPEARYARMGNVWFIPSCELLLTWLRKLGFKKVKLLNVQPTTVEEQRRTEWMQFHSLADFLDPEDPAKTIEGYPAPRRAIVTAQK